MNLKDTRQVLQNVNACSQYYVGIWTKAALPGSVPVILPEHCDSVFAKVDSDMKRKDEMTVSCVPSQIMSWPA